MLPLCCCCSHFKAQLLWIAGCANPKRDTHVGCASQIIACTNVQLNACLVICIPKYMIAVYHRVKLGLHLRGGAM